MPVAWKHTGAREIFRRVLRANLDISNNRSQERTWAAVHCMYYRHHYPLSISIHVRGMIVCAHLFHLYLSLSLSSSRVVIFFGEYPTCVHTRDTLPVVFIHKRFLALFGGGRYGIIRATRCSVVSGIKEIARINLCDPLTHTHTNTYTYARQDGSVWNRKIRRPRRYVSRLHLRNRVCHECNISNVPGNVYVEVVSSRFSKIRRRYSGQSAQTRSEICRLIMIPMESLFRIEVEILWGASFTFPVSNDHILFLASNRESHFCAKYRDRI